jgi:Cu(I)/Ag(I) efflux system membrane fusion protein
MKSIERHPPVLVWITGMVLGMLAGALLPSGLLFRDAGVDADHAHDGEGNESWACPMLCVVLDSPGNCPVCGMQLEPFVSSGTEVVLNRHDQEMIGLSIAPVEKRDLFTSISSTGRVEFDEAGIYSVTAWSAGRIDELYVSFEGERVSYGTALLDIYSPELYAAQQELLVLSDESRLLGDEGVNAAREKLLLLGASSTQIDRVLRTGVARSVFPVVSPAAGTVSAVYVTEGEYVTRGQLLFRVSDLSRVWLTVYLTEDQAGKVSAGMAARFSLSSIPGYENTGVVETVVPFLDRPGGSAEARIMLNNAEGNLIPGQTASVTFMGPSQGSVLSVPRSSVLSLGERSVVYVLTAPTSYDVNEDGSLRIEEARFEPREVIVGILSRDGDGNFFYPVLQGLEEGEVVALDGAFLIDSQAELIGLPSLLNPGGRR